MKILCCTCRHGICGQKERRMGIRELIGKQYIVFDGGFGSQLQARGVKAGQNSTVINITDPALVRSIHEDYLNAGAFCVTANTFGADRLHINGDGPSLEDVITAAGKNAREAVLSCGKKPSEDAFIFYDMAPTGRLLKPLGDLDFEECIDIFKEEVVIAEKSGLFDAFIIETMTDLYEVKAALLAVKENSDKPVIASVTFQDNGKMLTGASPVQAVTLIEGLGADMVAVNCSLGPSELMPIVKEMLSVATIPMLVQANAGLPKFRDGQTYYDITPEDFASSVSEMIDSGISGFGGCCGTTPDHIRACCGLIEGRELVFTPAPKKTRVTGTTTCVEIGPRVIRCGERLNPTGKKKMKQALLEGRLYDIVDEGLRQVEAKADVLDVNVGVPGIDETKTMTDLVMMLQEVIDLPLQIDSSDPDVIARACRLYNGIPLINSVNGKKEIMDRVFPSVAKYGGVVLGLCIDEDGIPPTAPERFMIAERIVEEAAKYGIGRHRIIIDSLVLTASAQQKEVIETARCVGLVTEKLGCNTALGLSNVSFGLPNRPLINRTFLVMALYAGLKMPILNPMDRELMGAIDAFEVLNASDEGATDYIEKHVNDVTAAPAAAAAAPAGADAAGSPAGGSELEGSDLFKAVVKGQKHNAVEAVKAMTEMPPLEIVSDHLIPALDKVGKDYDAGKIFLPQLMVSAETAKIVFDEIKGKLTTSGSGEKKGPIVIATVEADVHDIGKNIVKVVLQSYGFEVIDLGKDVKAQVVVDAVREYKPVAVGLSALMTTTVVYMEKTIKALRAEGFDIPVFCGGAVLTQDVTDNIGGDYYARDAMESVRICEKLNEERRK